MPMGIANSAPLQGKGPIISRFSGRPLNIAALM